MPAGEQDLQEPLCLQEPDVFDAGSDMVRYDLLQVLQEECGFEITTLPDGDLHLSHAAYKIELNVRAADNLTADDHLERLLDAVIQVQDIDKFIDDTLSAMCEDEPVRDRGKKTEKGRTFRCMHLGTSYTLPVTAKGRVTGEDLLKLSEWCVEQTGRLMTEAQKSAPGRGILWKPRGDSIAFCPARSIPSRNVLLNCRESTPPILRQPARQTGIYWRIPAFVKGAKKQFWPVLAP